MNPYLLSALDFIFPPKCLVCKKGFSSYGMGGSKGILPYQDLWMALRPLRLLCPTCFFDIRFIDHSVCYCCGLPFGIDLPEGYCCGDCTTSPTPFEQTRSVGYYETALFESIHRLKYNHESSLAKPLGRLMALYFKKDLRRWKVDLIIPIPLHKKRVIQRGYNQALLLAREVSKISAIPFEYKTLRRVRWTKPQVGLTRKARERNVKGAFELLHPEVIDGKRVLLIDDVYTTGATLKESARCLFKGGARTVYCLTVARVI